MADAVTNTNILIVDDDPQIRDVLRVALDRAGFDITCVNDGAAALGAVSRREPDLIILDIGMPEMDGLEVCRTLRRTRDTPVLFLTARSDEIDRVLGLELGADDYVTKPFSPRELVARVKAILKRSGKQTSTQKTPEQVWGILRLQCASHTCEVAGQTVTLTATEMTLLKALMQRPEQVVTRRQLSDAVYGTNTQVSDRTIDSHLRNLRAKLANAGCKDALETLHGVGVRMGPCHSE